MQQSFRVLLVEDDDSLRVCLGEFLSDHGWQVTAVARGGDAIEFARRTRFDFSILDFHLPDGTTGLQVFQRICAWRPLPAIMMSGGADREQTHEAQRAGIFTFLRKPLDLVCLRRSVELLIQHHFGGPLLVKGIGPFPGTPVPPSVAPAAPPHGTQPPGTPPPPPAGRRTRRRPHPR